MEQTRIAPLDDDPEEPMAVRAQVSSDRAASLDRLDESFELPSERSVIPEELDHDDLPQRYLVHNRTPWEIRVEDDDAGDFVVAPLGQRVMSADRLEPFEPRLRRLRQQHLLRVRPYVENRLTSWAPTVLAWVAVVLLVPTAVVAIVWSDTFGQNPQLWLLVLLAVAVSAGAVGLAIKKAFDAERIRRGEERLADQDEGDIVYGVGGEFVEGNEFTRRLWQTLNLVAVIVIGAVLPGLTLYLGTELDSRVDFGSGIDVVEGKMGEIISRLIQITYLGVLALFPAVMYFQFDRLRVGTLRGQWVQNIFRLDGSMRSLATVHAKYGDRLAEASNYSADSVRFLGGRRSPILVATILVALGWTLLVLRTDPVNFQVFNTTAAAVDQANAAAAAAADAADEAAAAAETNDDEAEQQAAAAAAAAAAEATRALDEVEDLAATGTTTTTSAPLPETGSPPGQTEDSGDAMAAAAAAGAAARSAELGSRDVATVPFFQLLNPRPSAAAMAFLGAYFFAVYLVLRGYFRGDLRPKVYNQITARLVTVVVIAYLINALVIPDPSGDNRVLWAMAFAAGVIPTTFLRRFGEGFKWPLVSSLFGTAFAEDRPLTLIDGIDIYERERLASEGLTDIEALAHNDLVSTMISTRLPMERLIDWTDQAILLLHLEPAKTNQDLSSRLVALRCLGIRTASDLELVCVSGDDAAREKVNAALIDDGQPDQPHLDADLLLTLVTAEPAYKSIQQWRTSTLGHIDSAVFYIDDTGQLLATSEVDGVDDDVVVLADDGIYEDPDDDVDEESREPVVVTDDS